MSANRHGGWIAPLIAYIVVGTASGQAVTPPDEPLQFDVNPDHLPPCSPGVYQGRAIAPVMSYLGADWLFRESRVEEEQPERMLEALKIQPGWTVADVGAGAGYTSLLLSRRVGPKGRVLASDVQPEMLRMLRANARRAGVRNITPILCTQTDPKLPAGQVDLILMVDVYHEMSDPEASVRGLRRALKPNGRMVLVEFRAEDPTVPIKPEHKMSIAQVRKEIEPLGFELIEVLGFLPWQHIIIFGKSKEPLWTTVDTLESPHPELRRSAARALAGMEAQAAPVAPWLIDRLADQDAEVREAAADALLRIGPATLPRLEAAARHDDPAVRAAAAELRKALTGQ